MDGTMARLKILRSTFFRASKTVNGTSQMTDASG